MAFQRSLKQKNTTEKISENLFVYNSKNHIYLHAVKKKYINYGNNYIRL